MVRVWSKTLHLETSRRKLPIQIKWKYTKIDIIFLLIVNFALFWKVNICFMVYHYLYFELHIYGSTSIFEVLLSTVWFLIWPWTYISYKAQVWPTLVQWGWSSFQSWIPFKVESVYIFLVICVVIVFYICAKHAVLSALLCFLYIPNKITFQVLYSSGWSVNFWTFEHWNFPLSVFRRFCT